MKKQASFFLFILFLSACTMRNTDIVSDDALKNDSLVSVVTTIHDTLPPPFDTTRFDKLAVSSFYTIGIKTGGKIYFSQTKDSVYFVITNVIKNHATQDADIVFLIDNTGSMTDDIENVKKNLNKLIDLLKTLQHVRVAVALYGDKNSDGIAWYKRTELTPDLETTRKFIHSIYVNGGGDTPESAYDALYKTTNELKWKSSSKRMILLIGDAPGLEPPLTEHNREEVINNCLKNDIKANVFPVLINTGLLPL